MAVKRLLGISCGKRPLMSLACATSLLGVGVMASSIAARPSVTSMATVTPVGHFDCYRVDPSSPVVTHGVLLQDQFGKAKTVTGQLLELCAPASKNGSVLVNPRAHLACYALNKRSFVSRTVLISNQLQHGAKFKVIRPTQLCLPSGKSVQPASPPAQVKGLGHYQCYAVTALTPFQPRRVTLVDQFGKATAFALPATSLCAPVSKNKSPVFNTVAHLLCYPLKAEQSFQARRLTITNQFGRVRLVAFRRDSVCVPSVKRVVTPPRPDLTVAIDKMHKTPESCNAAGCVTIVNFTVSNIGAANATLPFSILVEADPNLAVTETVAGPVPLAAGASQPMSVQVGPAAACYDPDCTVRVTVDSANTVAESNEANNTDTFTGLG